MYVFIYVLMYVFMYVCMSVLGLHCCTQAFSSCSERGLLFVAVCGLLIAVASLVVEHGLQVHGLQQLWRTGLVALWHVGSSQTRAQTRIPCIGRRILNHCATREVPVLFFKLYDFELFSQWWFQHLQCASLFITVCFRITLISIPAKCRNLLQYISFPHFVCITIIIYIVSVYML